MKQVLRIILIVLTLTVSNNLSAQVQGKFGNTQSALDVNAALEVESTSKGVLLPRLTTAQQNAMSAPTNGMLIYNTDSACFVLRRAGIWRSLCAANNGDAWSTLGNTGTNANTNFIGTTDAVDFVTRTNNTEKMRLTSAGRLGIATTAPTEQLHVSGGNIRLFRHITFRDDSRRSVTTADVPTLNPTISPYSAPLYGISYPETVGLADMFLSAAANQYFFAGGGGATKPRLSILQDGNIGINTTTSQYKLDIDAQTGSAGNPLRLLGLNAGATSDSIISSASGVLRRLSINQVLGNAWNILGNAGTSAATNFIGTTDAVDFVTRTNNTEKMRVTSVGNVGIGTTAPNAALQLGNIVSNRRMVMWETANNDHQYYGFGINNAMLRYQVDGTVSSHAFFAGTSATTSNELMRITGTGNVGIGTTAPTEKLDVLGNVKFSGALMPNNTAGTAGQILTSAGAGVAPTWGTAPVTSNIYTADGTLASNRTVTQGANTLNFAGTGVTTFNSGNVGIGTTTPASKLTVGGGLLVTANNAISAQGAHLQWNKTGAEGETWLLNQRGGGTANSGIRFGESTTTDVVTEWARFIQNGNLGIGTTAPTEKLDVLGNVKFSGALMPNNTAGTAGQILTSAGAGVAPTWGAAPVTSNIYTADGTLAGARTVTQGANNLTFSGTGNLIKTGGNVGIGTGTPQRNLDVFGAQAKLGIIAGEAESATLAFGTNNSNNVAGALKTAIIAEGQNNWSTAKLHFALNGNLTSNAASESATVTHAKMTIQANGNVGIGTTTPQYKLDLASGTLGFGNGNSRTETRDNAGLQGNAGAQSGSFETSTPTNYPSGATSWWHLIDTRHSVTTNNYALQIAGSFFDQELWFRKTNNSATTTWSRLLSTSNLNSYGWGITGNSGTTASTNFVGTTDAVDFVTRTNNTEKMRVTSAGNVGIGVTTPSQALEVNGSMYANAENSVISADALNASRLGFVKKAGTSPAIASGLSSPIVFGTWSTANLNGNIGTGTMTELMRIDATGNVGVATAAPTSTLQVNGSFSTALTIKTAAYTATSADHIIIGNATTAAFTVTLPTAIGIAGRQYIVKKTDATANAITVATTAAQTIDGASTVTVSIQWQTKTFVSDGTNWLIISNQ